MLASLYRIDRKSNKYYLRIVYYLISVCVNNAWILHKENRPEKQFILRDFIKEVSFSLMKPNEPVKQFNFQKKINDSSANDDVATVTKSLPAMNLEPPTETRFDSFDHWSDFVKTNNERKTCRVCKKGTTIFCRKCGVFLCHVRERNCFYKYHHDNETE